MKTTSFEHAGQNLWLDRGNAAKSSETKYELCRNSVRYKNRIGVSKVSGTVISVMAGIKIIG
jgi:hypothetical protein